MNAKGITTDCDLQTTLYQTIVAHPDTDVNKGICNEYDDNNPLMNDWCSSPLTLAISSKKVAFVKVWPGVQLLFDVCRFCSIRSNATQCWQLDTSSVPWLKSLEPLMCRPSIVPLLFVARIIKLLNQSLYVSERNDILQTHVFDYFSARMAHRSFSWHRRNDGQPQNDWSRVIRARKICSACNDWQSTRQSAHFATTTNSGLFYFPNLKNTVCQYHDDGMCPSGAKLLLGSDKFDIHQIDCDYDEPEQRMFHL